MAPPSRQELPILLHGCRKVTDVCLTRDGVEPPACAGNGQEGVPCQPSQQAELLGSALRGKVQELEECAAGDVRALQGLLDALQGESLRLQAALSAMAAGSAATPTAVDCGCPEVSGGCCAALPSPRAGALSLPSLARCSRPWAPGGAGDEVGLLFPGRGSEYVSMLADYQSIPTVARMLAKANDVLGYDIRDLCLNGPKSELIKPRHALPATFLSGLAAFEKLHLEDEEIAGTFRAVAGVGVGEFTALCAAGIVSFEDGLRLAQVGGEMVGATANVSHRWVCVMGLDKTMLQNMCAHAAKTEGGSSVCELVLDFFPRCYACTGTKKAVSILAENARHAGAVHVVDEPAHGALHTRLVKSSQEGMAKAFQEALPRMSTPKRELYLMLTGLPVGPETRPAEIVRVLTMEWTRPISWEALFRNMLRDGVTRFIELGLGTQSKDIMKRVDPKAWKTMRNVQV